MLTKNELLIARVSAAISALKEHAANLYRDDAVEMAAYLELVGRGLLNTVNELVAAHEKEA